MSANQFGTVGIIGAGLIGASLGLALKQAKVVHQMIGVGRSASNLDQALKIGAIDRVADLADAVRSSQWIVVCVPVAQMRSIFTQMEPHLAKNDKMMFYNGFNAQTIRNGHYDELSPKR
jgi:prephenate dehydrogenase